MSLAIFFSFFKKSSGRDVYFPTAPSFFRIYRKNEQCGSILNIWEEMEYESELSRNDIKYFRRACERKLTIQKCEAKDGNIQLNIEMAANEIMFIRMRRLI